MALQYDALHAAGVASEAIYSDKMSGSHAHRPGLDALLAYARRGDVLVVWKLDRLGRSLTQVIALVDTLRERGIELRSLTEQINTTSAQGRFTFHLFAALAELERGWASERTKAGLAAVQARGQQLGRPTVWTPAQVARARRMLADQVSKTEIAVTLGVSRTSVYRLARELTGNDDTNAPTAAG